MLVNQYVIFQTGNEEYGLPVHSVLSIEKTKEPSIMPGMPAFVRGIVEVRGELLPALDMGLVLYDKESSLDASQKMIVVQTSEGPAGCIVDEAKEILDIPEESVKTISIGTFQTSSYFSGVASLPPRLITLIDPEKLVVSLGGLEMLNGKLPS
ncbi:chemotaxis protein CheW [Bacillus lacus]|uniref:Chemotaxis protein CheW n=1 Tax=Metabacillus lacus TaxID=1983721 RepID=A0A7X2J0D5_9BACI|nr:chemotaxis protein CheW [Metabacillus lacus]MRX73128.1 chemotaxis protein CheW [Metabacillus lacus]